MQKGHSRKKGMSLQLLRAARPSTALRSAVGAFCKTPAQVRLCACSHAIFWAFCKRPYCRTQLKSQILRRIIFAIPKLFFPKSWIFFTICAEKVCYKVRNMYYKVCNMRYKVSNMCYKLCNKNFLI